MSRSRTIGRTLVWIALVASAVSPIASLARAQAQPPIAPETLYEEALNIIPVGSRKLDKMYAYLVLRGEVVDLVVRRPEGASDPHGCPDAWVAAALKVDRLTSIGAAYESKDYVDVVLPSAWYINGEAQVVVNLGRRAFMRHNEVRVGDFVTLVELKAESPSPHGPWSTCFGDTFAAVFAVHQETNLSEVVSVVCSEHLDIEVAKESTSDSWSVGSRDAGSRSFADFAMSSEEAYELLTSYLREVRAK